MVARLRRLRMAGLVLADIGVRSAGAASCGQHVCLLPLQQQKQRVVKHSTILSAHCKGSAYADAPKQGM